MRRLPHEPPPRRVGAATSAGGASRPSTVQRYVNFDPASIGSDGRGGLSPSQFTAVQAASESAGRPLPATIRAELEGPLGADLSRVRVHDGEASARAATTLQARAFTRGPDIHFGAGQYAPHSPEGMGLLRHEVAHTVQQRESPGRLAQARVGAPGDRHEVEADSFAGALRSGRPGPPLGRVSGDVIQREPLSLPAVTLGGGAFLRLHAVGRVRDVEAPGSPPGRTALLVDDLGQVVGQQLPGGVFRFHDGNELRTEGEPLAAGGGFAIQQPVQSRKPTGLSSLVVSEYRQAEDATFRATYEFSGDKASAGAPFVGLSLAPQDPALPVSLRSSIGSPEYYQLRIADFKRRNPDKSPPDYYAQYGDKYLHRFLGKLDKLSPAGQKWLKATLMNLQRLIEDRRDQDPAGYALLELDSEAATNFYYDTHPEAYIVSGLAGLPPSDLVEIAGTPDQADLLSYRGILQVVKVALVVGPLGPNAASFYGGPRP